MCGEAQAVEQMYVKGCSLTVLSKQCLNPEDRDSVILLLSWKTEPASLKTQTMEES